MTLSPSKTSAKFSPTYDIPAVPFTLNYGISDGYNNIGSYSFTVNAINNAPVIITAFTPCTVKAG